MFFPVIDQLDRFGDFGKVYRISGCLFKLFLQEQRVKNANSKSNELNSYFNLLMIRVYFEANRIKVLVYRYCITPDLDYFSEIT